MRRNKKKPKRLSVMANFSLRAAAVVLVALVMGIAKILSKESCTRLINENAKLTKQLNSLTEECQQEQFNWEQMTMPRQLNLALNRFHLDMRPAQESQVIRMDVDGNPEPRQLINSRQTKLPVASYKRKTNKR